MTTTSGYQQKMWVKAEATYDTVQAVAATDAVNLIDLKLTPEWALEASQEHVGTASHQREIAGLKSGKWSASSYLMPAALGVAPDIGPFLTAAFGLETIVGSTSVTYSFLDTIPPSSIQLARYCGAKLMEIATGCWVEQVEFELQGGAAPKVSFSGGFAPQNPTQVMSA